MTDYFIVVRFQPAKTMPLTGVRVPGWTSPPVYDDPKRAAQFGAQLDHSAVYQLAGPLWVFHRGVT